MRIRTVGKLLLKVAISSAFVVCLLSIRDLPGQLKIVLSQANWNWLAAALLTYGCVEMLGAIRWQFLLRHFGFRLSWWEGVRILLIGIFFNTLLPGLIAGDALRAAYLGRRFPGRKMDSILLVVMERVFGLLGLVTVGVTMMAWRFEWLHGTETTGALTDLALLVLGIGVLCALLPLILRRVLPGRLRRASWLGRAVSTQRFPVSGRVACVIFATTIAAHLCYAASFYCTGLAFASAGPTASALDMLAVTPIVNTFASLPISLSGLGVRESIFLVFLRDLSGVPAAAAMLIGSLGFAIRALWAVVGWLLLVCFRRLDWQEWTGQLFGHGEGDLSSAEAMDMR